MTLAPHLLFARTAHLETIWPFVPERLEERLTGLGRLDVVEVDGDRPLHEQHPLQDYEGIAWFGGRLEAATLDAAPNLQVLGGVTDRTSAGLPMDVVEERGIALIDATGAWAPSVAEIGLCLALCGLRQVTHWHHRMASGEPLWEYEAQQFCDDRRFVNGELGRRRVGVIGLGQIGSRLGRWARALGASVLGYDPFLDPERIRDWGVEPAPLAGALVVAVTRTAAIDMEALRERILADELAAALDVYDVEPLPPDDPLRGRRNVVHTPHIAGRTRDANLRVADIIASDFERILSGGAAEHRLSLQAVRVRTEEQATPGDWLAGGAEGTEANGNGG